jgi:hypothetical protein
MRNDPPIRVRHEEAKTMTNPFGKTAVPLHPSAKTALRSLTYVQYPYHSIFENLPGIKFSYDAKFLRFKTSPFSGSYK